MTVKEIEDELRLIEQDAGTFFATALEECKEENRRTSFAGRNNPDRFWNVISEELKQNSMQLVARVISVSTELTNIAKSSSLAGEEDIVSIRIATKTIRSALRLRRYYYREPEVLHDEGTVLGFRHADQSDDQDTSPSEARSIFGEKIEEFFELFELIFPGSDDHEIVNIPSSLDQRNNYRAGTAFIMMWMDPKQPELNDVADTVRSVFKNFDIKAVRADDIEHESLVTERILNEIKSSEFLFADLTGMRPNVYYEVGYAHALNKRVILFRKTGTDLHFDLAGYNCPDYQSLRDLKEKLTRRLEYLTNKRPIEK